MCVCVVVVCGEMCVVNVFVVDERAVCFECVVFSAWNVFGV